MTKQVINIGAAPNDNTGDLLRDAFDKVNQNFDEVYSTYNMSGMLTVGDGAANTIANSTVVRVSNATNSATLAANGLTVGSSYVGNVSMSTVNMTVSGNLTVLGFTTTINATAVDIADVNITIAKNATNESEADGAGITIAGAGAFINYSSTANSIVFSHPIQIGAASIDGLNYTGTAYSALYVPANNGIVSNSTGVFVDGNTGLVVNATGVHVNSSYVQDTDSRTLSGNLTFSGTNTTISSNTLNLGTSTVAANGYTYLPNGLKLNWGVVAANSTDGSVTFASAFGAAAYSVTATSNDSTVSAAVTTINTTSATILTSSATTTDVYYMAIGY